MRVFIPAREVRCRENSERVSYACLDIDIRNCCELLSKVSYSRISSVIRCELSIRPRSASNESAADDLYALHDKSKQKLGV